MLQTMIHDMRKFMVDENNGAAAAAVASSGVKYTQNNAPVGTTQRADEAYNDAHDRDQDDDEEALTFNKWENEADS